MLSFNFIPPVQTKSAGSQFKKSVKLSCPVVKASITIVNSLPFLF